MKNLRRKKTGLLSLVIYLGFLLTLSSVYAVDPNDPRSDQASAQVAALILQKNPRLRPEDAAAIIKLSSDDDRRYTGYGRVNPYKAASLASTYKVNINSNGFVHTRADITGSVYLKDKKLGKDYFDYSKGYELYYAPFDNPQNSTRIGPSIRTAQGDNIVLGTWDTTGLPDGKYILTLKVWATAGGNRKLEITRPVEVVVDNVNEPPAFVNLRGRGVIVGKQLKFKVEADDPDNPLTPEGTLAYSGENLPPYADFNSNTQIFSWMPDEADKGNYKVTFTVQDNAHTVSQEVTISTLKIEKTRITKGTSKQHLPAIYEDKVVWEELQPDGRGRICVYDFNKGATKSITGEYGRYEPAIYEDRVVSKDLQNGNSKIYAYNLSRSQEGLTITPSLYPRKSLAIYGIKIGNKIKYRVVWEDLRKGNADIYMYDLSTDRESRITSDAKAQRNPAIYEDKIVWEDYRNGNADIYYADDSTRLKITTDKSEQCNPAIYEDKIVWEDYRNGNADIYLYDLSKNEAGRITLDKSDQRNPAIYENKVVWEDLRNGNCDIYLYDLSAQQETQIVDDSNEQLEPKIYQDRIVWEDLRKGKADIYATRFAFTPQIDTLSSAEVSPGETITIRGFHFGEVKREDSAVKSDKGIEFEVESWSDIEIKCRVPDNAQTDKLRVITLGGESNPVLVTHRPSSRVSADTILINDGAAYTNFALATLTLSATDRLYMQFSNNGSDWSGPQSYDSSTTWDLDSSSDGLKTVYVRFQDADENWSEPISDTITLDTHLPTGSITINGNAAYTKSYPVNLTLSAEDPNDGTGVSQMQISNDEADWSTFDYTTTQDWTLTEGDGEKMVSVKFIDAVGNESDVYSDAITLDTTGPIGNSIAINEDTAYTNSRSVTLTLSAEDPNDGTGVSQMQISNTNPSDWSSIPEVPYATTQDWTLSQGDGTKTVYVRFKDVVGNWSEPPPISDTIILDTTGPAPAPIVSIDAIGRDQLSAHWTDSSDSESDIAEYQYAIGSSQGAADVLDWTSASIDTSVTATGLSLIDGQTYYFSVRAINGAGLYAVGYSGEIILDTTPPEGSVTINGNAAYTKSYSVTLTLSAEDSLSDVSQMQISNDGSNWSEPQSYASSTTWDLDSSSDGLKTVSVKFVDAAGNESAVYSDTIFLDTTGPTNCSITLNNGYLYTKSTSVTLALSATDTGSGMGQGSQMQISNDEADWSTFDYTTTQDWTLTEDDGEKTVSVKFVDAVGNESDVYSDTITLDATKPITTISITPSPTTTEWYNSPVTITLTVQEEGSGIDEIFYSINGSGYSYFGPFTISNQGIYTIEYESSDEIGNVEPLQTAQVKIDRTSPTGSITINDNAPYANSYSVTLNLSATDELSGMDEGAQMQFSNDGSDWSDLQEYASSATWDLSEGDGLKTVYVKFIDVAGNASRVYSDIIKLDATPPTNGSIKINRNATYSNLRSVTLTLSAIDRGSGLTQMRFSNDESEWSEPTKYARSATWDLSEGDGEKTVSVKFIDAAGNESDVYSDTITLDTTPPEGSIAIINEDATYTNSCSVTLTLSATDTGSGMEQGAQMRFSYTGQGYTVRQPYASTRAWNLTSGDGTKIVYVKFKDVAGNWSGPITDTIILDTTGPTGSFNINENAAYSNLRSVTLYLSAIDAFSSIDEMQMQISNTNPSDWSGIPQESYDSTRDWTLSEGNDGTRTVYVRFIDAAGNARVYSDTIILDTTAPIIPSGHSAITISAINGNVTYTNSYSVNLWLYATDALSGMAQMQFSNDGSNWSEPPIGYTYRITWDLDSSSDGEKTVSVRFIDKAGNTSVYSDTIILDTTSPDGRITINGGAAYTNSRIVTLTLSATDALSGAALMQFSNDENDESAWSVFQGYAATKSWTLSQGDGEKTVSVRFKDAAGNTSVYSDAIFLDTTGPITTISITPSPTTTEWYNSPVTITLTVQEEGSGIDKTFCSINGSGFSCIGPFTIPNEGVYAIEYGSSDKSGNEEPLQVAQVKIDRTPPTNGSVIINNNATHANSYSVTVDYSATDNLSGTSQTQFSNDGSDWWSEPESYAYRKAWDLDFSSDGLKTVYVKFIDAAGNTSVYSDTIILDTTAPDGSVTINGGAAYATNPYRIVTLRLAAMDAHSGVAYMWISEEEFDSPPPFQMAYVSTRTWLLSQGDGEKTIYVRFRDGVGNWSELVSDTIILDTTAPTGSITINEDAPYTRWRSVTLTLSADDPYDGIGIVNQMQISNTNPSDWSGIPVEPYAPTRIWKLLSGDGLKWVYVRFRDALGNWSGKYLDDIFLDTTPPTITNKTPSPQNVEQPLIFEAVVSDNIAAVGVKNVYLYVEGQQFTMDYNSSTRLYEFSLPQRSSPTTLPYIMWAEDNAGNRTGELPFLLSVQ